MSLVNSIVDISNKKYSSFLNKVLSLCLESAEKGNVYMIFNQNSIEMPWKDNNIRTLLSCITNNGFDAVYIDNNIKVSWKHLINIQHTDDTEHIEDMEHTEDIEHIEDMEQFIRKKLQENSIETNNKRREKICYEIYNTICQVENKYPDKNDDIFGNNIFINALLKKLNEFQTSNISWVEKYKQNIIEIAQRRNLKINH
jgi:hypothetical protein